MFFFVLSFVVGDKNLKKNYKTQRFRTFDHGSFSCHGRRKTKSFQPILDTHLFAYTDKLAWIALKYIMQLTKMELDDDVKIKIV